MRKPRYYEVLLVLACTAFYISSFEGFGGFVGVGLGLFVFSMVKYFEYMSERWVHIKYYWL